MKASEWLNVIKQSADYNPAMTPLIEKYGEMLVDEYKAENPPCECDDDEDEEGQERKPYVEEFYTPSEALSVILESSEKIKRTDVVKILWNYIKEHKLQDTKNRRMINADEKLKPIFSGKNQVSMFDFAKHLGNHLTK
jgi:chromatin remodeling complex protein RSC6